MKNVPVALAFFGALGLSINPALALQAVEQPVKVCIGERTGQGSDTTTMLKVYRDKAEHSFHLMGWPDPNAYQVSGIFPIESNGVITVIKPPDGRKLVFTPKGADYELTVLTYRWSILCRTAAASR